MSLLTYEPARPWARAMKAKVAAREMPPWFIDRNVGVQHFSNDVSLTDQEIATIVKWSDGGAPQGNPADMPPPRQFPDGQAWQIGKPDLIVTLPKDLIMKAQGPDWWPDITTGSWSHRGPLYSSDSDYSHQGLSEYPPHQNVHGAA